MKRLLIYLFLVLASVSFANAQGQQQCFTTNGTNCIQVGPGPTPQSPTASNRPLPVQIISSNSINIFSATDGSTTIISGNTAQNLFNGVVPTNGWTIINPDASEDCWASDTTTAAANATGSIRLPANGGGYETPPYRKPISSVSVVCPSTGHKLTGSRW